MQQRYIEGHLVSIFTRVCQYTWKVRIETLLRIYLALTAQNFYKAHNFSMAFHVDMLYQILEKSVETNWKLVL